MQCQNVSDDISVFFADDASTYLFVGRTNKNMSGMNDLNCSSLSFILDSSVWILWSAILPGSNYFDILSIHIRTYLYPSFFPCWCSRYNDSMWQIRGQVHRGDREDNNIIVLSERQIWMVHQLVMEKYHTKGMMLTHFLTANFHLVKPHLTIWAVKLVPSCLLKLLRQPILHRLLC